MSDIENYSGGEDENYSHDEHDEHHEINKNLNNTNAKKLNNTNDDDDDAVLSDDEGTVDDVEENIVSDGDEEDGDVDDAVNDSDDDMSGGGNNTEDDDIDNIEDGDNYDEENRNNTSKKGKKNTLDNVNTVTKQQIIIDDDDEDDDDYDMYLQKFDQEINNNYINQFHPECLIHNSDEIDKLSKVIRDENNIIVDPLHKTNPYLTKYERTRVLGQRAKQIETGANPFVKVPENIIDSLIIAELELKEKKIPFIIKRPIPGGAFEYWKLKDLEIIHY